LNNKSHYRFSERIKKCGEITKYLEWSNFNVDGYYILHTYSLALDLLSGSLAAPNRIIHIVGGDLTVATESKITIDDGALHITEICSIDRGITLGNDLVQSGMTISTGELATVVGMRVSIKSQLGFITITPFNSSVLYLDFNSKVVVFSEAYTKTYFKGLTVDSQRIIVGHNVTVETNMVFKFASTLTVLPTVGLEINGEFHISGLNKTTPINIYAPSVISSSVKLYFSNPVTIHRHSGYGEVWMRTKGTFICDSPIRWQGASSIKSTLKIASSDVQFRKGCYLGNIGAWSRSSDELSLIPVCTKTNCAASLGNSSSNHSGYHISNEEFARMIMIGVISIGEPSQPTLSSIEFDDFFYNGSAKLNAYAHFPLNGTIYLKHDTTFWSETTLSAAKDINLMPGRVDAKAKLTLKTNTVCLGILTQKFLNSSKEYFFKVVRCL
jgi:hypothetical protein